MITGIEWAIVFALGAATGATVVVFWDKIKSWASKVWYLIVDAINIAIEVASSALVYLIEKGGSFYKEVRVYVMNKTGGIRLESRRQEVSRYEVPDEIRRELERKREVMMMKSAN